MTKDITLCGDPTCEAPSCRQSAIDAWDRQMEENAQSAVLLATGVTAEPILIPCEGSMLDTPHQLCEMCGLDVNGPGPVPPHDRRDVLAMIHRGDFDPERIKFT